MLIVTYNGRTNPMTAEFHLGDRLPDWANHITLLSADGHELEVVAGMFPALFPIGTRVAVFPEPFCKLVYANLRYHSGFRQG